MTIHAGRRRVGDPGQGQGDARSDDAFPAAQRPLGNALRLADMDLGEIVAGFDLSDSVTIEARIRRCCVRTLSPEGLRFKEGPRSPPRGPGRLSISAPP